MNELHSDALLGGTWSWDDDDDVAFEDHSEQIRDLLRDLVDSLDD